MEYSVNTSFQYRPKALYPVSVYSFSERVRYCMVYFQSNKVTFILLIENIVPRELVCHYGIISLAYLFEYSEKLLSAQLFALIVIVGYNRMNFASVALLNTNYRCL